MTRTTDLLREARLQLTVILGVLADLAALLIAGFVFMTAVIMHRFGRFQDPQTRQMEQVQLSKIWVWRARRW